jgi:hypothetical protein
MFGHHIAAAVKETTTMRTLSPLINNTLSPGLNKRPALAAAWHPWTVVIPRRTITGRLVWGLVWRRRDGRHWLYKKFVVSAERRT